MADSAAADSWPDWHSADWLFAADWSFAAGCSTAGGVLGGGRLGGGQLDGGQLGGLHVMHAEQLWLCFFQSALCRTPGT